MAGDLEGLNEEAPRAAAQMMRKLFGASGLHLGPGIEAALRRLLSPRIDETWYPL